MPRMLLLALAVLVAAPLAGAQIRFDVSAGGGIARPEDPNLDRAANVEIAVGIRIGRAAVRLRGLDLAYERPAGEEGVVFYAPAIDASYAVPVGPVALSVGAGYRRHYGEPYRTQDSPFAWSLYAPVEAEIGLTHRLSTYVRSDFNAAGLYNRILDADRTQVGLRLTLGR